MTDWLARTELIPGNEALQKLKSLHGLVVGLGGVGGYAAEMICIRYSMCVCRDQGSGRNIMII